MVSSRQLPVLLTETHEILTTRRSSRTWTFSNVIAGSDSVTVVMRTLVYNLLAHPDSLAKLLAELRAADETTGLTRPYPQWSEVRELPFLDACWNEAVRLHPPFSLPLERVAPEGGVVICGRHFPQGTCIGMNPYVVNRHRPTFGEDADEWRPERWLVEDAAERKKMENGIMTVSLLFPVVFVPFRDRTDPSQATKVFPLLTRSD